MTALLDKTLAAVSRGDAAAVGAAFTEDATENIFGTVLTGRQEIMADIQSTHESGTRIERVSEVATNGEYVAFFTEWTNELPSPPNSGSDLSVFQLENGKIKGHWEFYLPDWPPIGL